MIITTTLGDMDETLLVKTTGFQDSSIDRVEWVEYRLPTDPEGTHIHRSVHVVIKPPANPVTITSNL